MTVTGKRKKEIDMESGIKEETLIHPEGMIRLMNGNVLKCWRKPVPGAAMPEDGLSLDTTGEFLSFDRKGPCRNAQSSQEMEERKNLTTLFGKYAFELYRRKDEIYSDSRMFLCPVDTGSGLAYTGRSGFTGATLGVWLEWWDSDPSHRKSRKEDRLVICLSGSPLSGNNSCSAATPDGKVIPASFSPFLPAWKSFMEINRRYRQVSQLYESYSLQEVIDHLFLQDM